MTARATAGTTRPGRPEAAAGRPDGTYARRGLWRFVRVQIPAVPRAGPEGSERGAQARS